MIYGVKVAVGDFKFTIYTSPLGIALYSKGCMTGHSFQFSKSTELALGDLQTAIITNLKIDPKERRTLQETFSLLKLIYSEVAHAMARSSVEVNQLCKFNSLVSWDYISMVQEGNNLAIVIFAYFSVLSAAVHGTWCMDKMYGKTALNYARHIMDSSIQYLLD
jgi:hypothetical protein